MSNVSDLTLGEKLALKGQLFELRKKLNAIELQNQQTETYSFRPELVTEYYELPDRESSYVKNVERAEQMRRQKLDMLKTTLEIEQASELTFSPSITNKSRRIADRANAQPGAELDVGRRLYNQHARIQENKARQSKIIKQFDPRTGQRMFSPLISSKSKTLIPSGDNELDAHEFMYRDAVDREERLRQTEMRVREEADRTADMRKLNSKSDRLLKQRAERETRALFDYLDRGTDGTVTYDDIAAGAETLVRLGLLTVNSGTGQSSHYIAGRVWRVLLEHPHVELSASAKISTVGVHDSFHIKESDLSTGNAEAKEGLTGQKIGLGSFTKRVLPVAARGFLGAQFDSRELYESTVSSDQIGIGNKGGELSPSEIQLSRIQPDSSPTTLSTPPRLSYHVTRSKQGTDSSSAASKSPRVFKPIILKSDIPKSLISAKTAAVPVKKASLGTTPRTPTNPHAALQSPHHLDQSNSNVNMNEMSFHSEEGGDKPLRLDDIPIHGRLTPASPKKFTPVISNSNEAVIRSAYATFRSYIMALLTLLKTQAEKAGYIDISSHHAKVRANALIASDIRSMGSGNFVPRIPERSHKLALTKEERDAAIQVQKALDDDAALANGDNVNGDRIVDEANKSPPTQTIIRKTNPKNSLEMLLERTRISQERKQQHKEAYLKEELKECTFQPKINRSHMPSTNTNAIQHDNSEDGAAASASGEVGDGKSNSSANDSLGQIYEYDQDTPAHERLYAMKDKAPRSNRIVHKTKEEIELEQCTFAPKLVPYKGDLSLGENAKPPPRPTGWDDAVQRLRNAAVARAEGGKIDDVAEQDNLDERYDRARREIAKGPKEFEFLSEKRMQKRAARRIAHSKPRLFIDVKLSAFRTANIPVYDYDNPMDLARRFCKIYSMPQQAHNVLEEVIRQSMESADLRILEEGDDGEGDDDGKAGDDSEVDTDVIQESIPKPAVNIMKSHIKLTDESHTHENSITFGNSNDNESTDSNGIEINIGQTKTNTNKSGGSISKPKIRLRVTQGSQQKQPPSAATVVITESHANHDLPPPPPAHVNVNVSVSSVPISTEDDGEDGSFFHTVGGP